MSDPHGSAMKSTLSTSTEPSDFRHQTSARVADEKPTFFDILIACPTFAFAFWTVATHVCVATHASFQTLARVGPWVMAGGVVCGTFSARRKSRFPTTKVVRNDSGEGVRNDSDHVEVLHRLGDWKWVAGAALLVALRAMGIGYALFWFGSVAMLIAAMVRLRRGREIATEALALWTRSQVYALALLAITVAALAYTTHRPDPDDAVYVGTAADAVAHPELPVLSHDVLYGGDQLPLMLPSYAVESYELLVAFFAHTFGGAPILWAHGIFPPLNGLLLAFAWATLMRALVPRHWIAATALALVILSLPADVRAIGNFGIIRMFQGKGLLASVGIPLLYVFAWKFEETGAAWDWLALMSASIGCVGLSSSAIFIVPVALGIAILSGWRSGTMARVAWALLPAVYPLACGLLVRSDFNALKSVFAYLHPTAPWAISTVFGERPQYILLFLFLAAPFLVRDICVKWKVSAVVLAYFLVPLNPFVFRVFSKLTTPEAVWRILWSVPAAAIVAVAGIAIIDGAKQDWGRRGMLLSALALVGVIAYFGPHSTFAKSNGVSYSLQPLKVRTSDWETARDAIAVTPASSALLAPEDVAIWVPTFVNRPRLVSVRDVYDEEMGVRLSPEDASTRRELRELVSGREFSAERTSELLDTLERYQVTTVVATPASVATLQDGLVRRGYSRSQERNGYVFFVSPNNPQVP